MAWKAGSHAQPYKKAGNYSSIANRGIEIKCFDQVDCKNICRWVSMNNFTLLQENEGPIYSPGFLAFSILLALAVIYFM